MRILKLIQGAIGAAPLLALTAIALGTGTDAVAHPGSVRLTPGGSIGGAMLGDFMQKVDPRTELVYISDAFAFPNGAVDVFTLGGAQVGRITSGLLTPSGLFTDAKGSLWVANEGAAGNVLVFAHGAVMPNRTLTDPVGPPADVTVCPDGSAYVADLNDYTSGNGKHASVQVYAPGHNSPTGNLNFPYDAQQSAITCDSAGNVFVMVYEDEHIGSGRVIEFPGGKQQGVKDIGIILQDPFGLSHDNAGNLLVGDFLTRTITEYTEAGKPTGFSISTPKRQIYGIAVSRDGRLILGDDSLNQIGVTWSYPGGKQVGLYSCCSRIAPPLLYVYGAAFYPGQF